MENEKLAFSNITNLTENISYESYKKILWGKSKHSIIFLVFLCTIIFTVLISILFSAGRGITLFIAECFLATIWLFLIIYFTYIFTLRNKIRYRKQARSGQAWIYKYSFGDKCITATWQTGSSTVFYDQISAIYYTKNTCILLADQNTKINECYVIDKNGFLTESYDDFIVFLKKRVTISK